MYYSFGTMTSGWGLFGFVGRRLCPCVLNHEENSAELASLVERNRQYQVSLEMFCHGAGLSEVYAPQIESADTKHLVLG